MKERFANLMRWIGRIWLFIVLIYVIFFAAQAIGKSYLDPFFFIVLPIALIPSAITMSIAYVIDGKSDLATLKNRIVNNPKSFKYLVIGAGIAIVTYLLILNISNFKSKPVSISHQSINEKDRLSKMSDKELMELIKNTSPKKEEFGLDAKPVQPAIKNDDSSNWWANDEPVDPWAELMKKHSIQEFSKRLNDQNTNSYKEKNKITEEFGLDAEPVNEGLELTTWAFIGIFYLLAIVLPIARILRRAGRSRAWAILAIFPLINVIGLWIFAFSKWPELDKNN